MKNFLFILTIFFGYTFIAHAADVSIVAPPAIKNNTQFSVAVDLNTDGVVVNSFDISVSYPKDIISFEGYKEEGSIKKSWFISPRDESGIIHFIGVIPNGVNGIYDPDKKGLQPIRLTQLLFSSKSTGTGSLTIISSDILKNDGLGTSLVHENYNASIIVSESLPGADTTGNSKDTQPPEPFTIIYAPASLFSRTPSMIIFSAIDKESGVEKYQLKTTHTIWKDVTSPLPTVKSLLRRNVVIRALDFSGNARESTVEIPGLVSGNQLAIIIILGVICYFTFYVIKRKR